MPYNALLAALSVIVIFGLSFSIRTLLKKNKILRADIELKMTAQHHKNIEVRNSRICSDIRHIGQATYQKQCNVSEAAIRLTVLIESLSLPSPIIFSEKFPALFELYEYVKEMPTHDARKEYTAQKIKILDKKREAKEKQLQAKIIQETKRLATFQINET